MCHCIVCFLIFKKQLKVVINNLFVCTNKFKCSCSNSFRSLGSVSHDKNGLSK